MTNTQPKLEDLFAAVLDKAPEERSRFLDETCGDDPALRRELEELLASEPEAANYFDDLAKSIATAASMELENAARPRVQIGPYRILDVIGRGGMGVVYRAARADGGFDQQVALKLLHLDMETEDIRARFRAERQLLAKLSHPNIAHLLDGGVTDEGRPYLVMEHVDGMPITRYCREQELTLEGVLRLFLDVTEAVGHLHRNLIVHRDLKPGNIFVDVDGHVKLLDFGIAKLLDREDPLAGLTRTGQQMLTPEYSAPEQVTGAGITTATDVYALGGLLFELLTGRRPFARIATSPAEMQDRLPTAPSAVLKAGSRSDPTGRNHGCNAGMLETLSVPWRRLPRDLDTICLKALRPEPERRYASAEQFGSDLERYLEGLPVKARSATLGYRLGTFVRRHRRAVVAACLVMALLAVFFVRERSLRGDAELARIEADGQAAKAVAVSNFLGELLASVDPAKAQGEEVTVADVLKQASERLERSEDFAEQPAVEAAVRLTVGNTYRALSRFDESMPHLKRAVELSGGVASTSSEGLKALEALGVLHYRREEYESAAALAKWVLEVRTETLGEDHPDTLAALGQLANALWSQGLYDEVEPIDRKTVEVRSRVLGKDHPDTLRSMNGLAATLFNTARYIEAAELFEQVLTTQKRVLGENHPDTLTAGNNLGACYMELCFYRKAEDVLRPVLAGRLRVLGEDDPLTWTTIHNLGAVLAPMARYDEAEDLLRRAAALRRGMTGDLRNYFFTRSYLADLVRDQGRYGEAEAIYLETLEEQKQRYGEEDAQALKTKIGTADMRLRQGRFEEAEALLAEVQDVLPGVVGNQHPDLLGSRTILARLRNAQGRYAEALELSRDVLESAGPAYDSEHPLMLDTQMEKILSLSGLGRLQEAAILAPVVHEGRLHRLGPDHPRTAEALALVRELGAARTGNRNQG